VSVFSATRISTSELRTVGAETMSTSPRRQNKKFRPNAADAKSGQQTRGPTWPDTSFRTLLDEAPDAMLMVNRAGEIVIGNAQAEKLFGRTREQLVGHPVESLIPPRLRDRHPQHRENFFDDPRVRPMGAGLELFALRGDGTEIPVEISLSPFTTEQ
jgi:PAS domain S-box-containing protein